MPVSVAKQQIAAATPRFQITERNPESDETGIAPARV
jgi:hypothetical protein